MKIKLVNLCFWGSLTVGIVFAASTFLPKSGGAETVLPVVAGVGLNRYGKAYAPNVQRRLSWFASAFVAAAFIMCVLQFAPPHFKFPFEYAVPEHVKLAAVELVGVLGVALYVLTYMQEVKNVKMRSTRPPSALP